MLTAFLGSQDFGKILVLVPTGFLACTLRKWKPDKCCAHSGDLTSSALRLEMSLNLKLNWNTNISEPNDFVLNKGRTKGIFLIHNKSHSMPSSYQQNIFRNHYLFCMTFSAELWELHSLCRRQNILSPQCFAKTKTWFLLPCVLLPSLQCAVSSSAAFLTAQRCKSRICILRCHLVWQFLSHHTPS